MAGQGRFGLRVDAVRGGCQQAAGAAQGDGTVLVDVPLRLDQDMRLFIPAASPVDGVEPAQLHHRAGGETEPVRDDPGVEEGLALLHLPHHGPLRDDGRDRRRAQRVGIAVQMPPDGRDELRIAVAPRHQQVDQFGVLLDERTHGAGRLRIGVNGGAGVPSRLGCNWERQDAGISKVCSSGRGRLFTPAHTSRPG